MEKKKEQKKEVSFKAKVKMISDDWWSQEGMKSFRKFLNANFKRYFK